MATPDELILAQAPIVRPDPIPRPEPVERPGSRRPNRFQKYVQPEGEAPAEPEKPVNRFEKYVTQDTADPAAPQPQRPLNFGQPSQQGIEAPQSLTADVIRKALEDAPPEVRDKIFREWLQPGEKRDNTASDVVKSFGSGLVKGVTGLATMPATIEQLAAAAHDRMGMANAPGWVKKAGSLLADTGMPTMLPARVLSGDAPKNLTYDQAIGGVEKAVGPLHKPQTMPGEYAQTIGEFAPGGVGGRGASVLRRVANVLAPAVTSETAGQVFKGTDLETPARVVGGMVGSFVPTPRMRASAPPIPTPLQNYDRGAVELLAQSGFSKPNALSTYIQKAQRLGPQGMLADITPQLRTDAARIARNRGEGGELIIDALQKRKAGAMSRINAAMDDTLGAPGNVPESVENIRQWANTLARPMYEQFYQSPVQVTPRLTALIERADADGLLGAAKKRLSFKGIDPEDEANMPRLLDQLKKLADDKAGAARRAGERETFADYSRFAKEIRDEADRATSGVVGLGPYAEARRMAGNGMQYEDAVELGRDAFRKSLSPDQMRADMQRLGPGQRGAYDLAARDSLRQVARNAASNFGPTGDNAIRRALGADNAREKVQILAGPERARTLMRRLDAETEFARTQDAAIGNSITSEMGAAAKRWPAPDGGAERQAELRKTSWQGLAIAFANKALNSFRGEAATVRALKQQEDAAKILIARGYDKDVLARALFQVAQNQKLSGPRRQAVDRLIISIMLSGQQAARQEGQ